LGDGPAADEEGGTGASCRIHGSVGHGMLINEYMSARTDGEGREAFWRVSTVAVGCKTLGDLESGFAGCDQVENK